ncbi:MAG: twin-arginine translocase subunit TatC [Elusimicrobiota bacterium]
MTHVDRDMTVTEHLEELRRCLIVCLIALFAGTAVVWFWSGDFLSWLAKPVGGLIFIAPTEAFFTRLKVAMFGGFLLVLPVVLYEAWSFTACAMGEALRRALAFVIPVSYLLFVCGVALAVLVVVPTAVRFLIGYGSADVRPLLTVGGYLDFVAMLSLAFGATFQIPLVMMSLERAGLVSRKALAAKRRYFYVGGFIMAAMLTPGPDVFSQLALAIPIVLLFEASLLVMRRSGSS